jgi:hypothetical protein
MNDETRWLPITRTVDNRWAAFTDDELAIIALAPNDHSEVSEAFRRDFRAELERRRSADGR